MTLERNATDGDTEVVLLPLAQDEGLKQLEITAPNGRRVAKFDGDGRGIGIREFLLESAEPPDLDAVLASFPEGIYSFNGKTVTGDCLKGTASLSHDIVPATQLLTPAEDEVVQINQLILSWEAVEDVERYVVELNNEDTGSEMTFDVFPPTTSVAIPGPFPPAGLRVPIRSGRQDCQRKRHVRGVDLLHRTLSPRGWEYGLHNGRRASHASRGICC
jgi:hypothetical protein